MLFIIMTLLLSHYRLQICGLTVDRTLPAPHTSESYFLATAQADRQRRHRPSSVRGGQFVKQSILFDSISSQEEEDFLPAVSSVKQFSNCVVLQPSKLYVVFIYLLFTFTQTSHPYWGNCTCCSFDAVSTSRTAQDTARPGITVSIGQMPAVAWCQLPSTMPWTKTQPGYR